MLRFIALPALLAAPFVFASLAPAPQAAGCANDLLNEPVVTYDIAGATFGGPFYLHLAVYNSGHAILSGTSYEPDPGRAQVAALTPAEVAQLRQDLVAAGVYTACDDTSLAPSDTPLTTVTMFRGTTNAAAHTFSYWSGSDAPYDGVDQRLRALIAAKFPNF